ncbi:hypothetical protein [Streptomyces sp. NPDC012888]|uniref:hypothetical protein n=1 Tax=Streptomyces sp. NPDC012888 TaxID=3364855 RepID=UPI003682611D
MNPHADADATAAAAAVAVTVTAAAAAAGDAAAAAAAARSPRLQQVTVAGQALAVALVPLVLGVLLAKAMAGDPMTPVNALITSGGQRARVSPAEWRRTARNARSALRRVRPAAAAATTPGH